MRQFAKVRLSNQNSLLIYYNKYFIAQNIAIQHIICFLASEYVVLKNVELCNEQTIIDFENECLLAARITENNYVGMEINETRPRGCYVNESGAVWFNPVGNRQENSLIQPICRKG